MRVLFLCVAGSLALAGMGRGQSEEQLAKFAPTTLAQQAWASASETQSLIVNAYLAKKYPNTVEGKVAAGFIAAHEGRRDDAFKSLNDALAIDPKNLLALLNLGSLQPPKEGVETLTKAVEIDSRFSDSYAIQRIYTRYVNELGDRPSALKFLATWEAKMPGDPVFDTLRGLDAQYLVRDMRLAEKCYSAAVSKHPRDFTPYMRLCELRLTQLSNFQTDPETRVGYLSTVTDYIKSHPTATDAWQYLGDVSWRIFKDRDAAFDRYRSAFHARPTAEAAHQAMSFGAEYHPAETLEFIKAANQHLPHNYRILLDLGTLVAHKDGKAAEMYFQAALQYAPTGQELSTASMEFGKEVYEPEFQYEKAITLFKQRLDFKNHMLAGTNRTLLTAIYSAQLLAQQYEEAETTLKQLDTSYVSDGFYISPVMESARIADIHLHERLAASSRPEQVAASSAAHLALPLPVPQSPRIAVSKDGKYAIIGFAPSELWDLKRHVRLLTFSRGGLAAFSPDGKQIAFAAGAYGVNAVPGGYVYVYDRATGSLVVQTPLIGPVLDVSWSPDGHALACATGTSVVTLDVQNRKPLASRQVTYAHASQNIAWDPKGRFIAVGVTNEDKIQVLDPKTLSTIKSLPGVSWPHSLRSTTDGKYLVCADDARKLSVWDTASWQLRQIDIRELSTNMVASPVGERVLLNDDGGGDSPREAIVDVASMRPVVEAVVPTEVVFGGFNEDGTQLLATQNNSFVTYSAANLKKLREMESKSVGAISIQEDRVHGYALVVQKEGIDVWNVRTGMRIHSWPGKFAWRPQEKPGSAQFLAYSVDNKAKSSQIIELNTDTLQSRPLVTVHFRIDALALSGDHFAIGGVPFTPAEVGAPNANIEVYTFDGKKTGAASVPTVTAALEYGSVNAAGVNTLDISSNGLVCAVTTFWQDGFGRRSTGSGIAQLCSMTDGKVFRRLTSGPVMMGVPADSAIAQVEFDKAHPDHIFVDLADRRYTFDVNTGATLNVVAQIFNLGHDVLDDGTTLQLFGDRIVLTGLDGTVHEAFYDGDLVGAASFPSLNLLVALKREDELEFRSLRDLHSLATVFAEKNGEWLAFASGMNDASPHGAEGSYLIRGDSIDDYGKIANQTVRHGLVQEVLANRTTEPAGPDFEDSGFEKPEVTSGEWKANLTDGAWKGSAPDQNGKWGIASGAGNWGATAHGGKQYAFMQRGGSVSQTVSGLKVGQTYRVTFWSSCRAGNVGNNDPCPLTVTADGVTILPAFTPEGQFRTVHQTQTFTAPRPDVTFVFKTTDIGIDSADLIDDVHLVAVGG